MSKFNPPEIIYLQTVDPDGYEIEDEHKEHITWCKDKINSTDVKYIRANVINEKKKVIEDFVEYLSEFNIDYISDQTGKDIIKQAKKIHEYSKTNN